MRITPKLQKRGKQIIVGLMTVCMLMTSAVPVMASSNSSTASNSSLKATIRSDAWIQTIADLSGGGEFQVTAAYSSTNSSYAKPEWVKTAWSFYAIGISAGVSYNGVSMSASGSGASSTSSGYWINSNGAKTAWYRGKVYATGLAVYVGLTNTASAFKAGVPISTTTKI